ncbi:GNAT family N-acetyltransferase [Kineococcus sp. T13]|uniref:GNAT family N-acetyltransferase n=1 Tax=Kineococcus vitellinus TaxID=2696565 RepID=UPI001412C6FF|nr:N-acetyltransferase [Kineococcus vitellinus]NAZ76543.1 GNAT family N-acetyltransferase [Kineococcus vitellinus]
MTQQRQVQHRPERAEDRLAVREVHLRAFGDHGPLVADLVDDLRARVGAGRGTSLVAQAADGVVGHVGLTDALLDAPRRLVTVSVLSPLAVLPAAQRRGVGRALVAAALRHESARGVPLVFLEGDPGYYSRLGFEPGAPRGFRKPSLRIPDAAFQVFPLPAHEPWMTGTLVYPDVFWRHDAVGLRDPGA